MGWRSALVWLVIGVAACAPALDWREMRLSDLHLAMSMPCRPTSHVRRFPLAGRAVEMTLHVCVVAGTSYSLGTLDCGDPTQVGPMLEALSEAARANLQGRVEVDEPAHLPGMTPHAAARRMVILGRRPDGVAVRSDMLVFSYGARVFQAIALGAPPSIDGARRFLGSLAVVP